MQRQTALQNVKMPLLYANMPEREQTERAKEMLRESTAGLARFYLGVMSQSEELGGEDVEAAKMNFDAACRDNRGDVN